MLMSNSFSSEIMISRSGQCLGNWVNAKSFSFRMFILVLGTYRSPACLDTLEKWEKVLKKNHAHKTLTSSVERLKN